MLKLESNTNTGGLSPTLQDLIGRCKALKPEDRALLMARMTASTAFVSPSANNDVSINSLERDVQDQVPNRFPSATNGRTALPDGSPMKVDNMSLPDASPVVDEELPERDDSTSESRLLNGARLEDRSSTESDTNLVSTQVFGALLPALLDKGGIPFLRRIRPALKKIATGEFQYPTWMPEDAENMPADVREHFTALKIPRLRGSTTPCLLLHDLGSSSDQEVGKLAKMLSTFVDIVHHKCFVNCSGSGKTRLCLESLCLKYGLYFTCATPELASDGDDDLTPQIGSRDLSSVTDTLINDKSFTQNLRDASVQDPIAAGKLNSKIAGPYLVSVLVSRLIIFLEYLGCLSKDQLHSMNAKRAWMYLQAQPFLDDDIPDVFASFTRHVNVLPQHYDKQVDPVSVICKQIGFMLGCRDNLLSLPIVIDEAQVGAETLGDAFLSSASIRHEVTELQTRPILREIVWSFATINIKVADQNDFHEEIQHRSAPRNYEPHVIITGSVLSREVASTAYVGVGTPKVMETVTDTGAFAIQEKQQRYLRKYFPSAWLDHEDGEILQYRAWIWLRGRHRFTASFVEYTLRNWQHAALHANVLSNMFVAGLSGNFEPWDALRYPMNLDGVSKPKDWDILAQLNKLPPSFKVGIRKEMCDYFIRNQRPAAIYDATEEEIQSGIGLVHRFGGEIRIIISEPLMYLTLFTFVNEPYAKTTPGKPAEIQTPLHEHLVQQASSKVDRFADLLAYYFSAAFEEPRPLNEVFNITCDGNRAVGCYLAQLVTVTRIPASDGSVIEVEGAHQFSSQRPGYAGPLGYRALDDSTAPRDKWGTHLFQNHTLPSPAPILFPGYHMGPDLLFLLKLRSPVDSSEVSYLWVAVKATLCHDKRVPISIVRSAIKSVTPENFFMTKDGEWNAQYEPHSKTLQGFEDGLPGPPTKGMGTYHVVCGYPAVVGPLKAADILDNGNHPIATLNVDQFKLFTKEREYQTSTKARAIVQKKEHSRAAGVASWKSKRKPSSAKKKGYPTRAVVPSEGSRPRQTRNSMKTAIL